MQEHVIVCFGDSNTHGYDGANGGRRFNSGQRWTRRLQKQLGNDYLVIEEGLNGRTIALDDPMRDDMAGISYIVPCLKTHSPVDLLIIMLGTNDTKERFGCNAENISLSLARLVRRAQATYDAFQGCQPNILIITPYPIDPAYEKTAAVGDMGKGCAQKCLEEHRWFRFVARQLNCHYLNAADIPGLALNHVDYIHLTAEGHAAFADHLAKLIPTLISG